MSEREAFEKWAIDQDLNITRGLRGEYSYMEPAYAWRVWQGLSAYRLAALEAERDALRKAAKGFYNATVAQPALRMSSASKQIVDDAEEAGERLRALIVEPTAAIAAKGAQS